MNTFQLVSSDLKELGDLYNLVATGQTGKAEKNLGRFKIICYPVPKFDPRMIRIDVKSISPGGSHD